MQTEGSTVGERKGNFGAREGFRLNKKTTARCYDHKIQRRLEVDDYMNGFDGSVDPALSPKTIRFPDAALMMMMFAIAVSQYR